MNSMYSIVREGDARLPAVVFVHGDLQNHSSFSALAEFMYSRGHTVVLFDLPGHGNSDYFAAMPMTRLLEDEIGRRGLSKPILVGHSFGGVLAAEYYLRSGNACALVLLNSFFGGARFLNPDMDLLVMVEHYLNASRVTFKKQEFVNYSSMKGATPEEISAVGLKTTDVRGFEQNMKFHLSIGVPDLKLVCVPVLCVTSREDRFSSASALQNHISLLSNAQLVVVEGTHNSLIIQPQMIVDAVSGAYSFFSGQVTT